MFVCGEWQVTCKRLYLLFAQQRFHISDGHVFWRCPQHALYHAGAACGVRKTTPARKYLLPEIIGGAALFCIFNYTMYYTLK